MASCLDVTLKPIDWVLCCLCQTRTSQSFQNGTGRGFTSLEKDLKDLEQLGALPFSMDLQRLDDGSGIVSTLLSLVRMLVPVGSYIRSAP